MPSNRELGFDSNWDEEKRLEWYRRKVEEGLVPSLGQSDDTNTDMDVSNHPFIKATKYLRGRGIPILVSPKGEFIVSLTHYQEVPDEAITLLISADIAIVWEE